MFREEVFFRLRFLVFWDDDDANDDIDNDEVIVKLWLVVGGLVMNFNTHPSCLQYRIGIIAACSVSVL